MDDDFLGLSHFSPYASEPRIFELSKAGYFAIISRTGDQIYYATLARLEESGFFRSIGSTRLFASEAAALANLRGFSQTVAPLLEQILTGEILDIRAAKFVSLDEQNVMTNPQDKPQSVQDMFSQRRWEATRQRLGIASAAEAQQGVPILPKRGQGKFPVPGGAITSKYLGSGS